MPQPKEEVPVTASVQRYESVMSHTVLYHYTREY